MDSYYISAGNNISATCSFTSPTGCSCDMSARMQVSSSHFTHTIYFRSVVGMPYWVYDFRNWMRLVSPLYNHDCHQPTDTADVNKANTTHRHQFHTSSSSWFSLIARGGLFNVIPNIIIEIYDNGTALHAWGIFVKYINPVCHMSYLYDVADIWILNHC